MKSFRLPVLLVSLVFVLGATLPVAQADKPRERELKKLSGQLRMKVKHDTQTNQRDEEVSEFDAGASASSSVLVRFDVQLSPPSKDWFIIEVNPDWAPLGAKRFLDLVDGNGPDGQPNADVSGDAFWNGLRFFRVINNFMAQFGIAGTHEVSAEWNNARIEDDPVIESNQRGYVSFATNGPNSRTTQMFINYKSNRRLDGMGFAPFAKVVKGMEVVDAIFKGYGEKPSQGRIQGQGNSYLEKEFPDLSYVISVKRVDSIDEGNEKEDELE